MARNLDAIDPSFVHDLAASQEAVWHVARYLAAQHTHVTIRALHVRPSSAPADIREYGDNGDLEVISRMEVKHRKTWTFTTPAECRLPEVIVDNVWPFDRAHPKPVCYFLVNRDYSLAIRIDLETRPYWIDKTIHVNNRDRRVYICPIEYGRFVDLRSRPV